ncbi:MAG: hypothetical protein IT204_22920 [Fimbriimonadaceae bacterium]|nr:hypothetical protein [Fimbriimonadaceae bacterium]
MSSERGAVPAGLKAVVLAVVVVGLVALAVVSARTALRGPKVVYKSLPPNVEAPEVLKAPPRPPQPPTPPRPPGR